MVEVGEAEMATGRGEADKGDATTSTTRARSLAWRAALGAILLGYFTLATSYNFAVPVGEAPDEPDHIQFVQIVRSTGKLPTIERGSPRYSYEAEQPPLYYLMQAVWMGVLRPDGVLMPVLRPNPDFSFAKQTPYNAYLHDYPEAEALPVHLMRLLSTLIGLLTLVLVWLACREAVPASYAPALLGTGFVALLPGFTFTSGTVTNDTLAACAGAALLYLLARALRRGVSWRFGLAIGAVLGLGLLGKRSLLVFVPLVLVGLLFAPATSWRGRRAAVATALAATLLVGAWPFVANVLAYGDPFATRATALAKGEIASPLANITFFWVDRGYIVGLFDSLWGVFGLRNVEMPHSAYLPYYAIMLVGLALACISLRRAEAAYRRVVAVALVALLLVYAGVAYQNTQFWAVQGRLLLPGLAGLGVAVGAGLYYGAARVPASRVVRFGLLALFLLGLFSLNLYALVGVLIPGYHG